MHTPKTRNNQNIHSNTKRNNNKRRSRTAKKGVDIGGYTTRPAKIKILKTDQEKDISRLEIIIHEGKNRQVRKMCEAVGRKVLALHRTKIGNIGVKDLPLGKWRYLKTEEINRF